jgi:hypothetical protein
VKSSDRLFAASDDFAICLTPLPLDIINNSYILETPANFDPQTFGLEPTTNPILLFYRRKHIQQLVRV